MLTDINDLEINGIPWQRCISPEVLISVFVDKRGKFNIYDEKKRAQYII